jgi:hypothetical protein
VVELAETRQTAEKKRETLQNRRERIEGPRRDRGETTTPPCNRTPVWWMRS